MRARGSMQCLDEAEKRSEKRALRDMERDVEDGCAPSQFRLASMCAAVSKYRQ